MLGVTQSRHGHACPPAGAAASCNKKCMQEPRLVRKSAEALPPAGGKPWDCEGCVVLEPGVKSHKARLWEEVSFSDMREGLSEN